jgi:hypothetical protein
MDQNAVERLLIREKGKSSWSSRPFRSPRIGRRTSCSEPYFEVATPSRTIGNKDHDPHLAGKSGEFNQFNRSEIHGKPEDCSRRDNHEVSTWMTRAH